MDFQPCMSASEIMLLEKYCPCGGNAIEFGAGGSTKFFFEHEINHLVSIESDKVWLEKLLQCPEIFTYYKYNKWLPLYANIGKTKEWGAPIANKAKLSWLNYHQYCWKSIKNIPVDLVLIDGRFRVACLLQTLLHCNHDSLTLVVHDFWCREHYYCILDFTEVIDRVDTLAVLKPKKHIDWIKLSLLLQERQFDFL